MEDTVEIKERHELNEQESGKKKKILPFVIIAILSIVAITFIVFGIYIGDYYHADKDAIETFAYNADEIYESTDTNGNMIFAPAEAVAGFVFYPGGKVEHTAYVPLMRALAERGVICVLIKMPFNLAIFNTGAAEGIKDSLNTDVKWYIGGHSLGGAAASMYAEKNRGEFDGLILLASYSNVDLRDTGMNIISIYGSEDKVLDREKYEECRANLPDNFNEQIIEGGCHAYFGMYGLQDGDGIPRITADEQIRITADLILEAL